MWGTYGAGVWSPGLNAHPSSRSVLKQILQAIAVMWVMPWLHVGEHNYHQWSIVTRCKIQVSYHGYSCLLQKCHEAALLLKLACTNLYLSLYKIFVPYSKTWTDPTPGYSRTMSNETNVLSRSSSESRGFTVMIRIGIDAFWLFIWQNVAPLDWKCNATMLVGACILHWHSCTGLSWQGGFCRDSLSQIHPRKIIQHLWRTYSPRSFGMERFRKQLSYRKSVQICDTSLCKKSCVGRRSSPKNMTIYCICVVLL